MNIDAQAMGISTAPDPREVEELRKLKTATGQLVGRVFFGAILAQARSSGLKGEYGHGGRGEDVFGAQLDAVFAERLGSSAEFGPAKALYEHLADQQKRMVRQEWFNQEVQG